jgi:hypothetical protein
MTHNAVRITSSYIFEPNVIIRLYLFRKMMLYGGNKGRIRRKFKLLSLFLCQYNSVVSPFVAQGPYDKPQILGRPLTNY